MGIAVCFPGACRRRPGGATVQKVQGECVQGECVQGTLLQGGTNRAEVWLKQAQEFGIALPTLRLAVLTGDASTVLNATVSELQDTRNAWNFDVLDLVASCGNSELLQALVEKHKHTLQLSSFLAQAAARSNQVHVVEWLHKRRGCADWYEFNDGVSPFGDAVRYGSEAVVAYMYMRAPGLLEQKQYGGQAPVLACAQSVSMATWLLLHGAQLEEAFDFAWQRLTIKTVSCLWRAALAMQRDAPCCGSLSPLQRCLLENPCTVCDKGLAALASRVLDGYEFAFATSHRWFAVLLAERVLGVGLAFFLPCDLVTVVLRYAINFKQSHLCGCADWTSCWS